MEKDNGDRTLGNSTRGRGETIGARDIDEAPGDDCQYRRRKEAFRTAVVFDYYLGTSRIQDGSQQGHVTEKKLG